MKRPYRFRVKVGDTVRMPDGHFAEVTEVRSIWSIWIGNALRVTVEPEGGRLTKLKYLFRGQLRWYDEMIDHLDYVSPEELQEIDDRLDFF